MKSVYRKLVVKIGTNVITKENGTLDDGRLSAIARDIAELRKNSTAVIVVSSGAMGAGKGRLPEFSNKNSVTARQVLASVGQIMLMERYAHHFGKLGIVCAQVLATKEDFRDRLHYLNMKNCFDGLLKNGVVPVMNENDVIAVSELMFTDNDELAGLIASMMSVDALILMTNVDGIFDRDPNAAGARVLSEVDEGMEQLESVISPRKSQFGRGGMLTKCRIALKLSKLGIRTHIVNGTRDGVLLRVASGGKIGTVFVPKKQATSLKRWIANTEKNTKGSVWVNPCAAELLRSKARAASLLPVGITKVAGEFAKGDIIELLDEKGKRLGMGLAQYDAHLAHSYIGAHGKKPLVHYDYLYIE